LTQIRPATQPLPQEPQFALLACRSVQVLLQQPWPAGQQRPGHSAPDPHLQALFMHTWPDAQTWPQAPQF
jgi:hypothetical protein